MAQEKTWLFDFNRAYSPSSTNDMGKWVFWYYKSFLTGQVGGSGTLPTVISTVTPSNGAGGTLAAGTYYYRVTVLIGAAESCGSNEITVYFTSGSSSNAMTWQAVTGATGYRVYRGTASGQQTGYYNVAGTSFTDTGAAFDGTASVPNVNGNWWVVASSNSTSASNMNLSSGGAYYGIDWLANWSAGWTYNQAYFVSAAQGSVHSWVLLRSPTMRGGDGNYYPYYVLLDYASANYYVLNIYMGTGISPSTTSSTTVGPHAGLLPSGADGTFLATNISLATFAPMHIHGSIATDGSFNILASKDASGYFFSGFVANLPKYEDLKVIDLYPLVVHAQGVTAPAANSYYGYSTTVGLCAQANVIMRAPDNSLVGNWGAVFPTATYVPSGGDSFDGSFADLPLIMAANNASYRSIRSRLQDIMHFGGGASTGSVDNPTGTANYMVVGSYWFPANTAPSL